jgi:hypothetical protein
MASAPSLVEIPPSPRRRVTVLVQDVLPVALIVVVGILAIILGNGGGPRGSHVYWLSVVLAESALALLMRRRHPVGAFAGVTGAYVLFDALAVSLLPILLATATVARGAMRRRASVAGSIAALAVVVAPILHRDPFDVFQVLPALLAIALAVLAGRYRA